MLPLFFPGCCLSWKSSKILFLSISGKILVWKNTCGPVDGKSDSVTLFFSVLRRKDSLFRIKCVCSFEEKLLFVKMRHYIAVSNFSSITNRVWRDHPFRGKFDVDFLRESCRPKLSWREKNFLARKNSFILEFLLILFPLIILTDFLLLEIRAWSLECKSTRLYYTLKKRFLSISILFSHEALKNIQRIEPTTIIGYLISHSATWNTKRQNWKTLNVRIIT